MTLWTSSDAVAATGGTTNQEWSANGVSIDTRTLEKGDLFVALKDVRDGHDFVAQALAKGACAAMVTHKPDDVSNDAPLLIVDDVLAGLERLGAAARARTTARIVAVTGSVGKTTTKEMLRTVLSFQGRTHASVASYNNHWGVPLTLARMPKETEFGVFEIGMNHPGEIAPLSEQVRPHVGMITTVAAAHLEAFGNIEGIAAEKAEIVAGLEPGGAAVLPADLDTAQILVDRAQQAGATMIGFGEKADAFKLLDVQINDSVTIIRAVLRGQPAMFKLSTPGRHFALNALGVLGVVEALGADPGRATVDLARWRPFAGRGQRETVDLDVANGLSFELIDDAYNANPTSLAAALEVLASANVEGKGRKIAILGDMLELGADELEIHATMAKNAHLQLLDQVHCVGERMKALFDALPSDLRGTCAATSQDMDAVLKDMVGPGDIVLVKGSNGSKVSRLVDGLRNLGHR